MLVRVDSIESETMLKDEDVNLENESLRLISN